MIVVAGVGMLFGSNYIMGEVGEGREKISKAQKKVDSGNSLFSVNPISKAVGKGLTGSAQKKIDAGSEEAARYEQMAQMLLYGGIGAIVVGVGIFFFSTRFGRRNG